MIKLERTSVMNMENAIRGARNPMNSWEKSDSYYDEKGTFVMGPADLDLGRRLASAGNDHRKFLRQIFVSVDITAPLYWWKEFDTYKVGTVANSCSTMHKIHAKPFDRDDFSHDRLDEGGLKALDALVAFLESERLKFVADKSNKTAWHNMIQLLLSSFNHSFKIPPISYLTLFTYLSLDNHSSFKIYSEKLTFKAKSVLKLDNNYVFIS